MKKTRSSLAAAGLATLMMWSGCFMCFVRGTKILTPKGPRPIEELTVGDDVFSFDVDTRKTTVRKVAHTLRNRATDILHLAAGELIIAGVTAENPFYDARRKEWTTAGALTKGTFVLAWLGSADVREIEITDVRRLPNTEPVEIFNLTIDGPEHNYFAEGFLVHNKDPPYEPPPDDDLDGFGASYGGGNDCDDTDPATFPDAPENCADGKDNDCDGWHDAEDPDCGGDPCPLPTGTLAIKKFFFGETNRNGELDLDNGWKQYGQFVDGVATTGESTRGCDPIASGSVVLDGNGGIDNSFGQNILPILKGQHLHENET